MAVLRSLVVTLGMNSASYRTELKKTQTSTQSAVIGIKSAVAQCAAFALALTTVGAATAKSVREMNNFARVSGVSTSSMRQLSIAAMQVGTTAEGLSNQFKDVKERVGFFTATSLGGMQDFFDVMKMNTEQSKKFADEMSGLSGQQVIQEMINRMQSAGVTLNEMSFALEGMGSDLTKVIPLMLDGGAELQRIMERSRPFAELLNSNDIKNYTEFAETVDVLGEAFKSTGQKILSRFTPYLDSASNTIIGYLKELSDSMSETDKEAASFDLMEMREELNKLNISLEASLIAREKLAKMKASYGYEDSLLSSVARSYDDVKEKVTRLNAEIKEQENLLKRLNEESLKPEKEASDKSSKITTEFDFKGTSTVDRYAQDLFAAKMAESEALAESLKSQLQTEEEAYEYKKELLTNYATSYEEFIENINNLDATRAKATEKNNVAVQQAMLQNEAQNLGIMQQALSGVSQYAEEGSALAKVAFLASQALAVSQIMVQAEQSKWTASAPLPSVAAQEAVKATIESQKHVSLGLVAAQTASGLAGMFHNGGSIPREGTYLLDGGETVYTRNQHEQLMSRINSGVSPERPPVNVVVQGNIYGDSETKRIIRQAVESSYARIYQDARTNGQIYKQMRR